MNYWSRGGLTNLDELVLVCGQHHSAVHLGLWELRMRDGVPWARPPAFVDPLRRWVRNTYHQHLDDARALGVRARAPGVNAVRRPPGPDEAPGRRLPDTG